VTVTAAPRRAGEQQDASYLRRLWVRRDFALYLAFGQVRARNASTALGTVWWVLNPLLLAGIYFLLFGVIFRAQQTVDNYLAYLLSGLFAFYYTRAAVLGATNTLLSNAKLMANLRFPRLVLPLAGLLEGLVGFFAAVAVFLVIAAPSLGVPPPQVLLLPVVVLLQTLFNVGVGAAVARLAVPFRDVRNFMPYALRLWLYASPVVYVIDQAPEALRVVLLLNPMTPYLDLYRFALLGREADALAWGSAVAWAVVAAVVGIGMFVKGEKTFARHL
jgi:teichoic acid transport system permease protein